MKKLPLILTALLVTGCGLPRPAPDEISVAYEDHPFWKQTTTGDALAVQATWYLRPRSVVLVPAR